MLDDAVVASEQQLADAFTQAGQLPGKVDISGYVDRRYNAVIAPLAGAQTDPDMRELRGYRLTMAAVRQVDAATQAMAAEMKKDPKYLEYLKLETEVSALASKEERTEADDARLEQLREEASVGVGEIHPGDFFGASQAVSQPDVPGH